MSDGNFSLGKNDEVNSLETPSAPQVETPVMKSHKDSNLVKQTAVTHKDSETAVTHKDLEKKLTITHREEKIALILSLLEYLRYGTCFNKSIHSTHTE